MAFEHVLHRPQLNDAEGCVSGRGGDFGCVALGGDDAGAGRETESCFLAGDGSNWMPSGLRQFGGQDLGEFGVGVYNYESLELDWLRLAPDRGLDVGDGMTFGLRFEDPVADQVVFSCFRYR